MQDIPYGVDRNKSHITPFVYGHYLTIHSYDPRTVTFFASDSVNKLPNGRVYDAVPFVKAIGKWSRGIFIIPNKPVYKDKL
jgi:hypothetical protein